MDLNAAIALGRQCLVTALMIAAPVLGIGMVVVCAPDDLDRLRATIDEPTWIIGRVVDGTGFSFVVRRDGAVTE